MLKDLELNIMAIVLEQELIRKEEIIVRINLEKQSENEVSLGYRAFKSILKNLESKSLIVRLPDNNYQLTTLGKTKFERVNLSLTQS